MSINFNSVMSYSWMSQASYLDLGSIGSSDVASFRNALTTSSLNNSKIFAITQTITFSDPTTGYSFISQLPNTSNGTSVTVFKSNANGSYTIAVRGTEPSAQLFTDLLQDVFGVVLAGKAKVQLIEAFRYYKQLTTPGGQAVTLAGGADNDTLLGGTGNDTYAFTSGDGWDWIDDSDGIGQIKYGSDTLTGGQEATPGAGLWESADAEKKYKYVLFSEADGSKTLNILSGTDRIFVKNFTDGKLGITLSSGSPIAPPSSQQTITLPIENTDNPEFYFVSGVDSTSSWTIIGDDVNNFIGGGDVDDQIEGRAGHDSIYGSTGKDRLYADTVISVAAAIEAAKQSQSDPYAELLDGGGGDDLLIGGDTNAHNANGDTIGICHAFYAQASHEFEWRVTA